MNEFKDLVEKLKLTPPFEYSDYGQTIHDKEGNMVLNVRGWGTFQYLKNGADLQDELGRKIAEILNKESI